MLLHIYILYSSWLYPGFPYTLCLLTGFSLPLFSLARLPRVMLSQLRTKCSLDEIQRGYAEKVRFCSGSIRKALERWTRKPCGALRVRCGCPRLGCGSGQPGRTAQSRLRGEPRFSRPPQPQDTTPQSQNLEMQWDIFLKSIFYQSHLIFFNKSCSFQMTYDCQDFTQGQVYCDLTELQCFLSFFK